MKRKNIFQVKFFFSNSIEMLVLHLLRNKMFLLFPTCLPDEQQGGIGNPGNIKNGFQT